MFTQSSFTPHFLLVRRPILGLASVILMSAVAFLAPRPAPGQPPAPLFTEPPTRFDSDGAPGSRPYGLAIADVVGKQGGAPDGLWKDVVVVNNNRNNVVVFANTGDWSPDPQNGLLRVQTIALSGAPYDVRIADMDGDGDRDLVVVLQLDPVRVAIILNKNDGTFENPINFDAEFALLSRSGPLGLAVGDFDGLNGPDFAITGAILAHNRAEPVVEVFRNQLGGDYAHEPYYPSTEMGEVTSIAMSRFHTSTPSGLVDLVVAGQLPEFDQLYVMRNNGDGTFTTNEDPSAAGGTFGIAAGWFHFGATRDVVFGDAFRQKAVASFNDGSANFTRNDPGTAFAPLKDPYGVATGKLNDDNTVDVAIACQHGNQGSGLEDGGLSLFVYDATTQLLDGPYNYDIDPGAQPKPCFVAISDIDRSTRNDVIVSCTNSGKISVLLNALPKLPDEDG